jgi:hypothetical protein
VLQQAVRDQVSGEEAARRVEALLLEDQPLAEAHYRLGSVSIGEALRSLMLVQKDDPKVRSTAADLRKEFVADEHPRAAELEDAIAQMFVEILRGDPETAEAVRALAPPPAPRKRRPSPLDAGPALAASPSAATKTAIGKEQGAVDAKINHRKGAWRAHCGNPMCGGVPRGARSIRRCVRDGASGLCRLPARVAAHGSLGAAKRSRLRWERERRIHRLARFKKAAATAPGALWQRRWPPRFRRLLAWVCGAIAAATVPGYLPPL